MIRVNGRYTTRQATGVDVHADEVFSRLVGAELLVPPSMVASGLMGHAWEQSWLAAATRRDVLWSPCNTGPVLSGRHLMTIHDVAPFDVPNSTTCFAPSGVR